MKAVGVKNLKNNLSRYLKLVGEGELVYVTDRDEIIAEIHKPSHAPVCGYSAWDAFLNREERNHQLIRANKKTSGILKLLSGLKPSPKGVDWKKIYNRMREDRLQK